MLYRLFTENKNYEQIKTLVCDLFDGATFIKAEGVWQGVSEHSLIIEIELDENRPDTKPKIKTLCFQIKKLNSQDKILVQQIKTDSKLI